MKAAIVAPNRGGNTVAAQPVLEDARITARKGFAAVDADAITLQRVETEEE